MTSPMRPWESGNSLQNSSSFTRSQRNVGHQPGPVVMPAAGRSPPVVPPRPMSMSASGYGNTYNSFMPYSGVGGLSSYGGYGSGYNSYGSFGMPYRSSMYGNYGSYGGGYNSYGNYGNYGMYGSGVGYDDHERRFIQFAEQSSRNTFASVESVVRAFNSLAMMLDNTFFAMTSSFRAVLGVAENFGRLRSMFGHIWYSINIFRFFNWLYRKLRLLLGLKASRSMTRAAWNEAAGASGLPPTGGSAPGSNWPTVAFLGLLVSVPYLISKFLPKYEDKSDPSTWKSPGVRAKACFDFVATSPNELTIHTNDIITLAPPHVQEDMQLKNTGWAFAVLNGRSGVVPVNYLIISKNKSINDRLNGDPLPVPPPAEVAPKTPKSNLKRVSFGETQVFEDVDDYVRGEEKSEVRNGEVNEDKSEDSGNNNACEVEDESCKDTLKDN